jgi:hypothetical protein
MGMGFRKLAKPVAWRAEPRELAFLAFDGTQPAPALAWRLRSSVVFMVL